jgi:hypothetical protein
VDSVDCARLNLSLSAFYQQECDAKDYDDDGSDGQPVELHKHLPPLVNINNCGGWSASAGLVNQGAGLGGAQL